MAWYLEEQQVHKSLYKSSIPYILDAIRAQVGVFVISSQSSHMLAMLEFHESSDVMYSNGHYD